MIGLSVSWCVRDIAEGRVAYEDVEKIIAGTRCGGAGSWVFTVEQYRKLYWREDPDRCEGILLRLLDADKIEQPRLANSNHFPQLNVTGQWVESESEIVWNDEEDR